MGPGGQILLGKSRELPRESSIKKIPGLREDPGFVMKKSTICIVLTYANCSFVLRVNSVF